MPNLTMSSVSQSPVTMDKSCVVEAFVTSAPTRPVSQYPKRSGIRSSVVAASSWAVPAAATSWYKVLNGSSWMPVRR